MKNLNEPVSDIGEFGLIAQLASRISAKNENIFIGIGDDAAAVDIGDGRLLLATCDIQIENIHFTVHTFTPEQIGAKAAAVNLSDIAAMGGDPLYALVSIAVLPSMKKDDILRIYSGLSDCLTRWGATVIGGNTSKSLNGLVIDITLLGETSKTQILTRNGASVGDLLMITGDLGASRLGLMLLNDELLELSEEAKHEALARHRTPIPRIAESRILRKLSGVTSCLDVSDGLLGDAARLSDASNVKLIINSNSIPIAACVKEAARFGRIDSINTALTGGEDFELLFTANPNNADEIARAVQDNTGTRVSQIGEVVKGRGVVVLNQNGVEETLQGGFDHFH